MIQPVRIARRPVLAGLLVAAAALVSFSLGLTAKPVRAVVPDRGDLYVGLDNGMVGHYRSTGLHVETLDSMTGSAKSTGLCFDASGNLISTQLQANTISEFNADGSLAASHFGAGYNQGPESCTVNAAGEILVGQSGGTHQVLKLDRSGRLLAAYAPTVGPQGTDWINLGADQCTLYYTSRGAVIRRFNVCTNSQMSDFAMAPTSPCYAHRVRPNGEVMLTCSTAVYRFGPAGNLLQTYSSLSLNPSTLLLLSLNLDPDNQTFWTADAPSRVYHVDIPTGTQIGTFPIPSIVGGLAVVGEPGQAPSPGPSPTATPTPNAPLPRPPLTGRATLRA
jgi:sugar lactone lactonase YvrE